MKRAVCQTCMRARRVCICSFAYPQTNKTHIVIIQDDKESKHPKSTAPLAKLSFKNVTIIKKSELYKLDDLKCSISESLLLFPTKSSKLLLENDQTSCVKHLFILDGTWRSAKRLLYSHPFLENLQSYHLPKDLRSINTMRKNKIPGHLSTFECIYHGLEIVEKKSFSKALLGLEKFNELYFSFKTGKL